MRRGEQDWAELVCHGSLVSRTPHCPIGHSGANRLEVTDGSYVSTSVEHKVGAGVSAQESIYLRVESTIQPCR